MELTYDWNCFQSMFYPKRRAPASSAATAVSGEVVTPVYLVVEDDVIISAFGEGEDFSPWTGASYQQMAAEVTHRDLILFERKDVDRWMSGAMALPHFYDQVEFLREKAIPRVVSRTRSTRKTPRPVLLKQGLEVPVYRHFILEAIQGWWAKVLPSSYGILIRLEGQGGMVVKDLLVVVRRGRVDSFCEPDFTILGRDRSRRPEDVVKYLSEKHLVPVQGIFLPAEMWQEWTEAENPWRKVAMAVRANQARLAPFRYSLVTLAATRGFLGI